MADQQAQWERIQQKTFTGWVNMHLGKVGGHIDDLLEDLRDGTNLLKLLEVISGDEVPKFLPSERCKMRIQKVENMNKALEFIAAHNVKLAGTGSEEIVDGNKKMTLGMIWTIILRFAIAGLSEEGLSAKEGLLRWVQKKTEPYDNVNVKDFTMSWQDGLPFCALIHRHRPDLLPNYDELSKDNAIDNCNLAFDICAEHLDIPKLLDAEDIVNIAKPDERSIMTYVAQMYKVFSAMDNVEQAGQRLGKFISQAKLVADMMHDYEERATALVAAVTEKTGELSSAGMPESYDGCKADIAEFAEYRRTLRRQWIAEQADLESLLSNIQAKLQQMSRPPYEPAAEISTAGIDGTMEALFAAGVERQANLNAQLRAILDGLRKAFAEPANALYEQLKGFKAAIAEGGAIADFAEQKTFFEGKIAEVQAAQAGIPEIQAAEDACTAANIEDNEYTDQTTEDLTFEAETLAGVFQKKIDFCDAQAQAEGQAGVSPEQIAEFKESFDAFDEDKSGDLTKNEFRSVMGAVGQIAISFDGENKEFDELFARLAGEDGKITFDEYLAYMVSVSEEAGSADAAKDAFGTIAQGKAYVTRQDLQMAQLDPEHIEHLCATLPPYEGVEGGYDFAAWLASQ